MSTGVSHAALEIVEGTGNVVEREGVGRKLSERDGIADLLEHSWLHLAPEVNKSANFRGNNYQLLVDLGPNIAQHRRQPHLGMATVR